MWTIRNNEAPIDFWVGGLGITAAVWFPSPEEHSCRGACAAAGGCFGVDLQLLWSPTDVCPNLVRKQVPEGKETGVSRSVESA